MNGGSQRARAWGRLGLSVGAPIALVGMGGFAYGVFEDRRGLEISGGIVLGIGAALALVALPLLVSGSTSVRNEKADLVARALEPLRF